MNQVVKDKGIQMVYLRMDDDPDQIVIVAVYNEFKPSGRILENDNLTVKGSASGTQSYTTVLGNDKEVPFVIAEKDVIDNGK